jgi:hypothetical protein
VTEIVSTAHTIPAAPDPRARYRGTDPSTTVTVEIDGAVRDARVGLGRGWRRALSPDRLGPAVSHAFAAATTARLEAWAATTTPTAPPPVAPAPSVTTEPASRDVVDRLGRAWRDLHEFGLRLTELHQSTQTVFSPGRHAAATVRGGQIVSVDLDRTWRRHAPDADLEHHLTAVLNAALAAVAAVPKRALEGCPDLADVLAGHPHPTW